MTVDSNIRKKIIALMKTFGIVMWFYVPDIIIVRLINIFFQDTVSYKDYIMANQYQISLISKVICLVGLVLITKDCIVIDRESISGINIYKIVKYILLGLVGWIIGTVITSVLLPFFPSYEDINLLFDNDEHIYRFIVIVIMAPFIEEYIFRGKIQNYIKGEFGVKIAIILQALIFAGMHGLALQQIYAAVLGVYLGIIKEREANFYSTFIMHVIINFIGWYIGMFIS